MIEPPWYYNYTYNEMPSHTINAYTSVNFESACDDELTITGQGC